MKTLFLVAVIATLVTGCSSPVVDSKTVYSPPELPHERRATASELLEAANTGVIPSFFSAAERRAVIRLQN